MRILTVTQSYYPFLDRGGPAFKVHAISRSLAAMGHEVTVLTAELGFGTREVRMAGASKAAQGWRSSCEGVEAIYLRTWYCYRNLTANPGVLRFCRRRLREFHIVHIYGLYDLLGPAVALYCRHFGIPYVVEPLGMTRPIDRGFALKKLWHYLFGRCLSCASRIIATSEQERAELLLDGFAAHRVLLRHNGIQTEEFQTLPPRGAFRRRFAIRDDESFIVFLGRLIPPKGAELLIDALQYLEPHKPKVMIAGPEGETGYCTFLRNKVRSKGLETRVLFHGPLYGDDKKAALVDADVFALPSQHESFGNAAADAIACGTPVVVSDRCGIASLVKGRAGVVTRYSAEALAQSLRDLLTDKKQYQQLKAGCAEVASQISWDKLTLAMQESYEDVRSEFLRRPSL
jgi:glycosyltransferase involved in cell wall biosynthesis